MPASASALDARDVCYIAGGVGRSWCCGLHWRHALLFDFHGSAADRAADEARSGGGGVVMSGSGS